MYKTIGVFAAAYTVMLTVSSCLSCAKRRRDRRDAIRAQQKATYKASLVYLPDLYSGLPPDDDDGDNDDAVKQLLLAMLGAQQGQRVDSGADGSNNIAGAVNTVRSTS